MSTCDNSTSSHHLVQFAYPALICFPLGGELLGRIYPDSRWTLRLQSLLGLLLGSLFVYIGAPLWDTWLYLSFCTAFASFALRPVLKAAASEKEARVGGFLLRGIFLLVGVIHLLPPAFYLTWGDPNRGLHLGKAWVIFPSNGELFLYLLLIVAWLLLMGYAFVKTPLISR